MLRRALYRMFRLLSRTDYRVRRRFTRGGGLALGALAAAAVVGLDTNQTVAYQAFTFLLAVLVLALAAGFGFRLRFAARRVLPRFATAGQPVTYRVVIENRTRRSPARPVLLEEVPDPRPVARGVPPGGRGRRRGRQLVGPARGLCALAGAASRETARRRSRSTRCRRSRRAGSAEVRVELRPLRRGLLSLAGVTVARPDPFGLVRGLRRVALPDTLLVLPRRYPVPPIRLAGTRKFQQGGVALASSVGDSEEFAALRDYRPGDPRRRIHWRSWARVGRPVVREHQDEFFARHALVLDTFAGAGQGERFEAAVSVAASLACALDTGESLLDLLFVGPARLLADRRPRAGPSRSAARGAGGSPRLPGRAVLGAAPARADARGRAQRVSRRAPRVGRGAAGVRPRPRRAWDSHARAARERPRRAAAGDGAGARRPASSRGDRPDRRGPGGRCEHARRDSIGAGVLFWGWQTGLWLFAVPIAALLESARFVAWRWDFSQTDTRRVADLSRVVLAGMAVYLGAVRGVAPTVLGLIQWFPLALLPLVVCQAYGARPTVDLRTFFLVLRRRRVGADPALDVSYPYLALCVAGASAANVRTAGFYLGLCVLVAWALWPHRSRAVPWPVWGALLAARRRAGLRGARRAPRAAGRRRGRRDGMGAGLRRVGSGPVPQPHRARDHRPPQAVRPDPLAGGHGGAAPGAAAPPRGELRRLQHVGVGGDGGGVRPGAAGARPADLDPPAGGRAREPRDGGGVPAARPWHAAAPRGHGPGRGPAGASAQAQSPGGREGRGQPRADQLHRRGRARPAPRSPAGRDGPAAAEAGDAGARPDRRRAGADRPAAPRRGDGGPSVLRAAASGTRWTSRGRSAAARRSRTSSSERGADTASTSRRRPCCSCGRPGSPRATRSATRCPSGARTRGAISSGPATPTRGRRRGWTERGATSTRPRRGGRPPRRHRRRSGSRSPISRRGPSSSSRAGAGATRRRRISTTWSGCWCRWAASSPGASTPGAGLPALTGRAASVSSRAAARPGGDSELYLIEARLAALGLGRRPWEPVSAWLGRLRAAPAGDIAPERPVGPGSAGAPPLPLPLRPRRPRPGGARDAPLRRPRLADAGRLARNTTPGRRSKRRRPRGEGTSSRSKVASNGNCSIGRTRRGGQRNLVPGRETPYAFPHGPMSGAVQDLRSSRRPWTR